MIDISKISYEIDRKDGKGIQKVILSDVIAANDIWETDDHIKILSLSGQQKIADKEGIVVKKFDLVITPSVENHQQHGVVVWLGFTGDNNTDNWRYATGEASKLNTGEIVKEKDETGKIKKVYKESRKIDSKYRLAMADKRAFGRALFKMIRLYGVYSELDSSDFIQNKPVTDDGDYNF